MDKNSSRSLFGEVTDYQFMNFTEKKEGSENVQSYSFQSLDESQIRKKSDHQKVIKLERAHAEKNSFQVSPIVKEHRGLQEQEELEREERIQSEVNRKIALIEKEAFQRGYEDGVKAGHNEVFEQTRVATEEKLSTLTAMISEVLKIKGDLLFHQRKEVYHMVRNLTKWVILRELKDDGVYIERLLEKLITEMQSKSNLLVQVNKKDFEQMDDVLNHLQESIGKLTNVRVEIDYDIDGPGLILQSENGMINGTLSEQLNSLDKLFEVSGLEQQDNQVFSEVDTNELVNEDATDIEEDS